MMNLQEMQMELIQINEAIDTIDTMLKSFGRDEQLIEQLRGLLDKRKDLIERIGKIQ